MMEKADSFGIGWRPELAGGILANLDRIDVVEVIADDYFEAPRSHRRALRTLAAQIPIVLHGVTLGLASAGRVEAKRLEQTARLIDDVRPQYWSEHLAFVRGGGVEIGHLAAPPRTGPTVEGAVANLELARHIVGDAPLVENVATLIEPPGSDRGEAEWISEILISSNCDLLLDLHNLFANGKNFGFEASDFLSQIPISRVSAIHLAGGKWVAAGNQRRLLDDHLNDVPDPVYGLLEEVGALARRPLTVILERDGCYPSMECLLEQLDRARAALREGRKRQTELDKEAA